LDSNSVVITLDEAKANPVPGTVFHTGIVRGVVIEAHSPHNKALALLDCSFANCDQKHERESSDWHQCHRCSAHARGRGATRARSASPRRPETQSHTFPRGERLPCPPYFVVHSDWGTKASKRWAVRATLSGLGYLVSEPFNIRQAETLVEESLQAAGENGPALLGFDFAFGVPIQYAKHRRIDDFLAFVIEAESELFDAADEMSQVRSDRPFLAVAARGDTKASFLPRVGLTDGGQLRRCERRTPYRRDGRCIFWPGAGQVAGATRSGWKEVLQPALRSAARKAGQVRVWPFDGLLPELVEPGTLTLVETYPAEFYAHLGMSGQDKGKHAWRTAQGSKLISAAAEMQAVLDPELRRQIEAGFGPGDDGEDKFDATVGTLGLLRVALGLDRSEAPPDDDVRRVEGWIISRPTADF